MTFYETFHFARVDGTEEQIGLCLHPISLLFDAPVLVISPFNTKEDAIQFVTALVEAQNDIIDLLQEEQRIEDDVPRA